MIKQNFAGTVFEPFAVKHKIMNSINKNQPEENQKDLLGEEAVEKVKQLVEKAGTCFFCTDIRTGNPFLTRPMAAQKTDDDGNIYFLSASDSNHNIEIEKDPMVQLLFQGSSYDSFLTLYGKATISRDKAMKEELWNPMMKTWFTEGKDDPRITLIIVEASEGYYWDTKHGKLVSFVKRLVGAATGTTLDDSIEGTITL
jgi:general stress protein 26